jgi:hypothetical protein
MLLLVLGRARLHGRVLPGARLPRLEALSNAGEPAPLLHHLLPGVLQLQPGAESRPRCCRLLLLLLLLLPPPRRRPPRRARLRARLVLLPLLRLLLPLLLCRSCCW